MKLSRLCFLCLALFALPAFAAQLSTPLAAPRSPYRTVYFPTHSATGGDLEAVRKINEMLQDNPGGEVVSTTSISVAGTTTGIVVVMKLAAGEHLRRRLSKEEFDRQTKAPPEISGKKP